jgi:hypothetical protein
MIFIISYTTTIWNIQIGVDTNFFVANSRHFVRNILNIYIFSQIHHFAKKFQKLQQKSPLLPTIWKCV